MAAEVNSTKPLEKSEHLSSSNYFFKKSQEEGTLPNLFSEASLTLTPKPDKDLAKIKLQANVTDEHRRKNPQQKSGRQDRTIKGQTPWSSRTYPRDARLFQDPQTSQRDTAHRRTEESVTWSS